MYIPTLDPKIVGDVISELRRKKGVSQEVLSGLADIGRTHLSAIECGERKPTLETLYRISCALDIKMSDIVAEIEKNLDEQEKPYSTSTAFLHYSAFFLIVRLTICLRR